MRLDYDLIVVGGGHAGCEAAVAAARLGSRTLLITMDIEKVASMSCNPAVGGVAKGQIVREIDALGGQMGIITDLSTIQFRMLNRSKGAAMWSPRAQCDKARFSDLWRKTLENTPNLFLWQDTVIDLLVEDGTSFVPRGTEQSDKSATESRTIASPQLSPQSRQISGVKTALGVEFQAKAVVLTAGTFLNGLIHVGRAQIEGGRIGDGVSKGLTERLIQLGFEAGRMKTGTPARLDGRTINFEKLEIQEGDTVPSKFSFSPETEAVSRQLPCYIANTSPEVHDTLRTGFADSPLFNGTIQGIGPRYCPSIEDKLRTFADKSSHQLFLEPEGADTNEYYLNGFSSSLPWLVQIEALQRIEGLENVHLFRPGYAIEYDYFPPTQLHHTMATKLIPNLYFAGQINGTTGYEEAAAQGLIAGINAALAVRSTAADINTDTNTGTEAETRVGAGALRNSGIVAGAEVVVKPADTEAEAADTETEPAEPKTESTKTANENSRGIKNPLPTFTLRRDEAYIGVLIDDLVTKGVDEPYRMFTSRAEYRILLRQDNADLRLTPHGRTLGLIDDERWRVFEQKKSNVESLKNFVRGLSIAPRDLHDYLISVGSAPLTQGRKLDFILSRGEIALKEVAAALPALQDFITGHDIRDEEIEQVEIEIKYRGYIEREKLIAEKLHRLEEVAIPAGFDFAALASLTMEARQKLSRIRPSTIGQASRIPGVSPADINVLLVYFGR
jgi:tRNA uridine 5-carboxymethylaminomethyl modification enzyme